MANIDFLSVAGLKRIATQGPPRASCYVTFDKSSAATTNHVLAHCSCGGNVLHFEDTAHNGRQQIDVWRYMIAMGKLVVAEVSIYDSYILTFLHTIQKLRRHYVYFKSFLTFMEGVVLEFCQDFFTKKFNHKYRTEYKQYKKKHVCIYIYTRSV